MAPPTTNGSTKRKATTGGCNDNCCSPAGDGVNNGAAALLTPSPIAAAAAAANSIIFPTDTPSSPNKKPKYSQVHDAFFRCVEACGCTEEEMKGCIAALKAPNYFSNVVSNANDVLLDMTAEAENVPPARVNNSAPRTARNLNTSLADAATAPLNPKAFQVRVIDNDTGETEPRSRTAACNAKKKATQELEEAVRTSLAENHLTPEQQSLVLHEVATGTDVGRPVVEALQQPSQEDSNGEIDLIGNLKETYAWAMKKSKTNDAQSWIKTINVAWAPSDPTKVTKKMIGKTAERISVKTKTLSKHIKEGMKARMEARELVTNQGVKAVKLVRIHKRKGWSIYTPEFVAALHDWIMNISGLVQVSPKINDTVWAKNALTGIKERVQKRFYASSVRDIHNRLKKPVKLGGFELACNAKNELQISDASLRALMPSHLTKMTDSHMTLCGCETCIISKNFVHILNKWTTVTHNSLMVASQKPENAAKKQELENQAKTIRHWNHKADGSPKWKHPRDIVDIITCPKVDVGDGRHLHKLSCVMGRGRQAREGKGSRIRCCPEFQCPEELHDVSDDAPAIFFEEHRKEGTCTVHGNVKNGPQECPDCKEIRVKTKKNVCKKKKPPPTGKCFTAKQLTRNCKKIGDYMENHFVPQMRRYKCHQHLVTVLSKHFCIKEREMALARYPGSMLEHKDFAEYLTVKLNHEIQSSHFGGSNPTASMEGSGLLHCTPTPPPGEIQWRRNHGTNQDGANEDGANEDPDRPVLPESTQCYLRRKFRTYISDDHRQDSRTVHANDVLLIQEMRELGLLEKGSKQFLMQQMDGCGKQYRCGNALFLMSVLSELFDISIDRMISPPGHGKGTVDAENGVTKNWLRMFFRTIKVEGVDSDVLESRVFRAALVDENGMKVSIADALVNTLRDPERKDGVKGGKKHAKREAKRKNEDRDYVAVHHTNIEEITDNLTECDEEDKATAKTRLPILNSKFGARGWNVAPKFQGRPRKGEKVRKGINDHYHFYTCKKLGFKRAAARRIPCSCKSCHDTLMKDWDDSIPAEQAHKQPRFQRPPNCKLAASVGDLNDWKIIEMFETDEAEEAEALEICDDILALDELEATQKMKNKGHAACLTVGGYDIFQIVGEPCGLEHDGDPVVDCKDLKAGTMVCKGKYLNKVPGARGWHTPWTGGVSVFRVRHVIHPNLDMENPSNEVKLPNRRDKASIMRKKPKHLPLKTHNLMLQERFRRSKLDFEEGNEIDGDDNEEQEEE